MRRLPSKSPIPDSPPAPGYVLIHSKRIRHKSGRVLYAAHYGLKCFTFWAKPRRRETLN